MYSDSESDCMSDEEREVDDPQAGQDSGDDDQAASPSPDAGGDGEPAGGRPFSWTDGDNFVPNMYIFDLSNGGITDDCPIDDSSTYLDYFMLFCTSAIMDLIVLETNNYFDYCKCSMDGTPLSRMQWWKDCDVRELWVFLGLALLMPLVKKHRLNDYWDSKDNLLHVPTFGKYMKRDRFLLLLRFLHFSNVETEDQTDDLRKIRPVYSLFKQNFTKNFRPLQKLVL